MGKQSYHALVSLHGCKIEKCSLLQEEIGMVDQKHTEQIENNKTAIPSIIDTIMDISPIDKLSAVSDVKESSVSDCHISDY